MLGSETPPATRRVVGNVGRVGLVGRRSSRRVVARRRGVTDDRPLGQHGAPRRRRTCRDQPGRSADDRGGDRQRDDGVDGGDRSRRGQSWQRYRQITAQDVHSQARRMSLHDRYVNTRPTVTLAACISSLTTLFLLVSFAGCLWSPYVIG